MGALETSALLEGGNLNSSHCFATQVVGGRLAAIPNDEGNIWQFVDLKIADPSFCGAYVSSKLLLGSLFAELQLPPYVSHLRGGNTPRCGKLTFARLPEEMSGPPQASGEENEKKRENGKQKFAEFRFTPKFMPPTLFFPFAIFCVVAALYLIPFGYSQLESRRWPLGLCAVWGGTLLAGIGIFNAVFVPIAFGFSAGMWGWLFQ
jgi:hypothetical protein